MRGRQIVTLCHSAGSQVHISTEGRAQERFPDRTARKNTRLVMLSARMHPERRCRSQAQYNGTFSQVAFVEHFSTKCRSATLIRNPEARGAQRYRWRAHKVGLRIGYDLRTSLVMIHTRNGSELTSLTFSVLVTRDLFVWLAVISLLIMYRQCTFTLSLRRA